MRPARSREVKVAFAVGWTHREVNPEHILCTCASSRHEGAPLLGGLTVVLLRVECGRTLGLVMHDILDSMIVSDSSLDETQKLSGRGRRSNFSDV